MCKRFLFPLTNSLPRGIIHLTVKLIVKYFSGGVPMGLQQTLKALAVGVTMMCDKQKKG